MASESEVGRQSRQAPPESVRSFLAASRVACSGANPHATSASSLLPKPGVAVGVGGGSLQLISLPSQACVTSQSQFLPCQWVLEHSSHHLPQADEFKTCAERKEIWGMEQMQTASSCYKTNVAPLKPPTNPTLGGLFICSVDKGRAQWKKSQQSHFRNSHSGEGFSFSRSADVTKDLKGSFQEMKRFSSVT